MAGRLFGVEGDTDEEEPLIDIFECRICQEEDSVKNLEAPCACSGSLKYAHRKCVQHWCNEKGDTTCEICQKPYQPGYTAPPSPPPSEETAIDINGGWMIGGNALDLNDPRILTMTEVGHHFLEAEYDDSNAATNDSGPAFCRSATCILMALLLLRHAFIVTDDGDDEEDACTIIALFLLRVAGFLLPCYIMAWAISMMQQRRERQEAAAMAATQFSFVVQSGHTRDLHLTIASPPPLAPQQEPL